MHDLISIQSINSHCIILRARLHTGKFSSDKALHDTPIYDDSYTKLTVFLIMSRILDISVAVKKTTGYGYCTFKSFSINRFTTSTVSYRRTEGLFIENFIRCSTDFSTIPAVKSPPWIMNSLIIL